MNGLQPPSSPPRQNGALAWMARHPVAANLVMAVLIVGGLVSALQTKQEVFPEIELDNVTVSVSYPGASPNEVEQGLLLAIEEAIRGIDGVNRVTSTAYENRGTVVAEITLGAAGDQVLADIKSGVDRITTFPEEAEAPVISLATRRQQVVSLIVYGDQELQVLHDIAERARGDLLASGDVTQIELEGVPPLEIAIEVPREQLEKYGLTLPQIAREVSQASLELPGGSVTTTTEQILVRVAERRRAGHEFEDIILRRNTTGSEIRLGDIATIHDGYEDNDQASFYDGKPAVRLTVFRVGDETPTQVSAAVHEFRERLEAQLPDEISLAIWADDSEILDARIDLLLENAGLGLLLVIIILSLFLDLRLAFWVSLGIPISFLGAFLILGMWDASINMITLFAFIVTLGMVVDDAIVVGERTYTLMSQGMTRMRAAITAAREMVTPVTFAILTSVAAFAPLALVPGTMGKIFRLIPAVVISVLLFSLVESFFILPAHLGHGKKRERPPSAARMLLNRIQGWVRRGLERFIESIYRPLVRRLVVHRYTTVAVAVASLLVTLGLVGSGRLPFNFFPEIEGDVITVQARMPYGTPIEKTRQVQEALQDALGQTIDTHGGRDHVRGVFTRLGEELGGGGSAEVGSHLVAIEVSLVPSDRRPFDSAIFTETWRRLTPTIPGLESISYSSATGPGSGAAVAIQLVHADNDILAEVSQEVTDMLGSYPGLRNVRNEYTAGKPQLDFSLRPEARALGLTSNEIALQLRSAFYGSEAIREQRGRNEIRVMVRLPEAQRRSEYDLERFMVRTANGGHIPLGYVASFERAQAPTAIRRENGRRKVTVTAELALGVESSRQILEDLKRTAFPDLRERYPDLRIELVGSQREQQEAFGSMGQSYLVTVFVLFALLAIPFRSYSQPLIIMAAVPFGFVGAVVGHLFMGYSLSLVSIFGIIALSGVVVNDSLVLIDRVNHLRAAGKTAMEAVIEAGAVRLRPILLTSLTTFFGLMPMIVETSASARFLVPMAISLGFGVLFATVIALLVVPALYMIVEDLLGRFESRNTPV